MNWKNIDIIAPEFVELLLIDKLGHYFTGRRSVDYNNFIIITRYELQDQGHYAPKYSTINKNNFVKYCVISD